MNAHLSSEEISQWLAGERDAARRRHVDGCAQCSGAIERVEGALREFRGSVHAQRVPAPARLLERRAPRTARWVLASAAVVLAVAAPVYRHRQEAAERARADAILLDQVDAEVSQAVPGPMEPLVQLVSWNSSEGNGETQ